jgi:hypothetical protein
MNPPCVAHSSIRARSGKAPAHVGCFERDAAAPPGDEPGICRPKPPPSVPHRAGHGQIRSLRTPWQWVLGTLFVDFLRTTALFPGTEKRGRRQGVRGKETGGARWFLPPGNQHGAQAEY